MPTHWLKVEKWQVGFKYDEKVSCSVFYLSKYALFSEGTMNAETHSESEQNVKVIQVCVALGTLYVRVGTLGNHQNKLQNSCSKELLI